MADAVLVARDLWESYDGRTDVLRGAGLKDRAGEAAVVWGDNGSGKTTLLSVVGGLGTPNRGTVAIAGHDANVPSVAAPA